MRSTQSKCARDKSRYLRHASWWCPKTHDPLRCEQSLITMSSVLQLEQHVRVENSEITPSLSCVIPNLLHMTQNVQHHVCTSSQSITSWSFFFYIYIYIYIYYRSVGWDWPWAVTNWVAGLVKSIVLKEHPPVVSSPEGAHRAPLTHTEDTVSVSASHTTTLQTPEASL